MGVQAAAGPERQLTVAGEEVLPPTTMASLLPLVPPVQAATGQILAGPTNSPFMGCRRESMAVWAALLSQTAILGSLTGILRDAVSTRS